MPDNIGMEVLSGTRCDFIWHSLALQRVPDKTGKAVKGAVIFDYGVVGR